MKVGVLGGGQLAQMMALAGYPLGIKVIALESTGNCPAGLVTDVVIGDYIDQVQLRALSNQVDVVTYEFENVDLSSLDAIPTATIYPPPSALAISQDRLLEKSFFDSLSVPVAQYFSVESVEDLKTAVDHMSLPVILKTRRLGYDGKGQIMIKTTQEIETAFEALGGKNLIVEQKINFDREVSCIAVRHPSGEIAFYDLIENKHIDGILRTSVVITDKAAVTTLAQIHVENILTELNYVGVLTVEFFEKHGELIANEMAPRVHNSGHWTIEGAYTSQFENHLRAVLNLPLGSAKTIGYPAMVNIISQYPPIADVLSIPQAHCHFYGKAERQGRKIGHVTLSSCDAEMREEGLERLQKLMKL